MEIEPKIKAFELYYEFSKRIDFIDNSNELDIATRKVVIFHLDEIIKELHFLDTDYDLIERIDYYNEVKKYIISNEYKS